MTSKFGDPLTPREQWVLELTALDGMSYPQVAEQMRTTLRAAEMTGQRIKIKLGAATLPQAVHRAMAQGIIGAYPNCGTRGGVGRHERDHTPLCVKCRIFWGPYRLGVKRRSRERAATLTS